MKTYLVTFTPKGGFQTQIQLNAVNVGAVKNIVKEMYKNDKGEPYIGMITEVR